MKIGVDGLINLIRIPIKKVCQGYYLRWYYNGWHHWFFLPGSIIINTDGEKYRTIGTRKLSLGSGQVTYGQVNALRTIMNSREVSLLTVDGWMNVRIEPGSVQVANNYITGYEFDFIAIVGSREDYLSPIVSIPESIINQGAIVITHHNTGIFTITISGHAGEDIIIDWGDGSPPETITLTGGDDVITHDYTGTTGEHIITIEGEEHIVTLEADGQHITAITIPPTATSLEELILPNNEITVSPVIPDTVPLVILDLSGNPLTICEITIGSQVWMCYNYDSSYPGSKVYNNDEANRAIYGGLYSWNQAMSDGFCPAGWHIPTVDEWDDLFNYLGGYASAGGKLKELGTTHWNTPNTGADNSSGFTALPGGYYDNTSFIFFGLGLVGYFLTANNGYDATYCSVVKVNYNDATTQINTFVPKINFMGIRLIKNFAAPAYVETFSLWYLPSKDELIAIYNELYLYGLGGFVGDWYWSSSEYNATYSRTLRFTTGGAGYYNKINSLNNVRAIRWFLTKAPYLLRDNAPGGGYIFQIVDMGGGVSKCYECYSTDQSASQRWSNVGVLLGTTGTAIGDGLANTATIIGQHGGANDWFLPSKDELNAMYTELHLYSLGGFVLHNYECSSEAGAINQWLQDFSDGTVSQGAKVDLYNVRACRSFTSLTNYNLRDVGPTGGYIFWKSGNDYIEAAPTDQSSAYIWSDAIGAIGTTGTAIGTGQANTTAIINQVGHTDSAAKLCDDYNNIYTHTDSAAKLCDDLNP